MATNFELYYNKKFKPLEEKLLRETDELFKLYSQVISSTNKSNAYWSTLEKNITLHYKNIDRLYKEWNLINIPMVYRKEMLYMNAKISNTARINAQAKTNVTTLIKSDTSKQLLATIVNDSISSMSSAIARGETLFKRFSRLTQQKLVNEAVFENSLIAGINEGDIRPVVTQQYKILLDKLGDKKFLEINGRQYQPRHYAELVTRTKFHETQANGALLTAANYGTDLIRVSSHNTTTVICQQYEGKIYSISGTSTLFPRLFETSPFHPNCLHLMFPEFVEGYSNNTVDKLAAFSNGDIDRPPFPAGFIPVKDRKAA